MVWFDGPTVLGASSTSAAGGSRRPPGRLPAGARRRELALLAAGGLLYTAGAILFARGRPNPWPATFGFHEVWHPCVVTAALCHWLASTCSPPDPSGRRASVKPLRLDELEVEVDLDDVAEHRPERTEAEAELLAPHLAGRLEAGMTGAVDEVGDPAELDGELHRPGHFADRQVAVERPVRLRAGDRGRHERHRRSLLDVEQVG